MRNGSLIVVVAAASTVVGCAVTTTERLGLRPLQIVAQRVDLRRFSGIWYELARFPHPFQRSCAGTTVSYELRDEGLGVVNSCRIGSPVEGQLREARASARVLDPPTNARLEVLDGPFAGPAWIIDLDPHYRHAVIGEPGRDYLWILSRSPTLPAATFEAIVKRLVLQGYEMIRLKRTVQATDEDGS